jgi:hypothetical protein
MDVWMQVDWKAVTDDARATREPGAGGIRRGFAQ